MQAPLSSAELKRTLAAYAAAKGNQTAAAAALRISPSTMKSRITAARAAGVKVPVFAPVRGGSPPVEAGAAEAAALHRSKAEAADARKRLKEALERAQFLEDRLSEMTWAGSVSLKPAEWTLKQRRGGKSEHIPYLMTSDAQIGEVIDPRETEYGGGYNTDIYRKRHRHLIDTTIYLSTAHAGGAWTYPGIVLARGGDTISGDIHEELLATNDVTPQEACEIAFEEESAGIYKLLEAFGRVEVKDLRGGNHDRGTLKPHTKKAVKRSYDRTVSYMLRREFAKDTRVSFQLSESPDVFFNIYDHNILLTHGDKIGSRGGQGFIGPAATIMRGAQKIILEQSMMGRRVDAVHMGHFHTFLYYDWVLCNGCYPGYSEYAKVNRMRPSPPMQTLMYYHKSRGVVDIKPILLEGK